jgi:plastocyanin
MTRGIGVLAVAGVVAIAGCGGGGSSGSSSSGSGSSGSSSGSSSSSTASSGGHTLQLAADPSGNLKFDTSKLTAKAGTVTIDFTNKSSVPHAVAVEGNGVDKDGKTITGGKDSLTVKLKPGTYTFYCPVDGHRAAGMKGTLVVK